MATTSDWTATTPPAIPLPKAQPLFPRDWTVADLQKHLGGVPAERIRLFPQPGTATVEDVLEADSHEDRICELVEGTLVEKPMASYESILAIELIFLLKLYLKKERRGILLGEAGSLRILPRRVRIPDISFISWDRLPEGKRPEEKVFQVAPDLVVEVLSEGNTKSEMNIKLEEYFQAGVRLVWYIDPPTRTATIYTALNRSETIDESGFLDGLDVLPGFKVKLGELFDLANEKKP